MAPSAAAEAAEAGGGGPCPDWGSLPREVLQLVFASLPLKERCLSVCAVSPWWRQVALEAGSTLLQDLNLNKAPLFAQRTRNLPDFYQQRASFILWLLRRRGSIRRLSLTAERYEDDSLAVVLRLAVAEVVAADLEALRLVSTESGRATSAFLSGAASLKELHLDFWGRSNGLPRAMADCTALTKLSVQCSSGLDNYKVLSSLQSLQDLSVVDCDWQAVPAEALQLPLTRLHLRFADFAAAGWMPADAGRLASTLRDLALPGCQISELPGEELAQLSALTSLCLERNYIRHLPPALSRLRRLQRLSLEGCASLRELPTELAAALPLRSLNLLHTGVLRLPLAVGARRLSRDCIDGEDQAAEQGQAGNASSSSSTSSSSSSGGSGGSAGAACYLRHLTELRWGVAEWEASAAGGAGAAARRWVAATGSAADATGSSLPDLSPVLQASGLRVLQLAHVPAGAESELSALRQHLPLLTCLQVNSAVLLP